MKRESGASGGNAFLSGNFAPVSRETEGPLPEVIGRIPRDLDGAFLRNGPNPVFVYDPEQYHWFDGDGMVHMVSFSEGRADYRNRFVNTRGLGLEREQGAAIWRGFSTLNDIANAEEQHGMMTKNTSNTNLVWHRGRLLSLWEGGPPHRLRYPALETEGEETFGGDHEGNFSAHPKIDPRTQEMVAVSYSLVFPPYCKVCVVDKDGVVTHSTAVDLPKATLIHDTVITERYTLVLDFPLTFDLERGFSGERAIAFEPDKPARIGVLERHANGDGIRWFAVKSGVVVHTTNAYESGAEIILDACRMDTTTFLQDGVRPTSEGKREQGMLTRYRIDLDAGTVNEEILDETPCDFPQINPHYLTKKNRYTYAACFSEQTTLPKFNKILKHDSELGTTRFYQPPDGHFLGEAVFAAKKDANDEDDGYLICFAHDERQDVSQCLILDAKNMEGGPLATIRMPQRVPYGFHAYWVSGDRLRAS
jgi:carotenoid cleavage dioxygenase